MTRRGIPKQINWYLREWMDYLGKNQTFMRDECGWSKASASQLYNNKQDYNPAIVNQAARALNVEPFELLMKPEQAMAFRHQRQAALTIVSVSADRAAAAEIERDPDDRKLRVRKVRK